MARLWWEGAHAWCVEGQMSELEDLVRAAEDEAARLEAAVEARRQRVIISWRERVAGLRTERQGIEAALASSAQLSTHLEKQLNQEEARHELELAAADKPRSPFPRLHWAVGQPLAIALSVGTTVMSLGFGPVICVLAPVAWWLGRAMRRG